MANERVDIRELASRLSEWLSYVAQGNEITVVEGETPLARLLPPEDTAAERIPGRTSSRSVLPDANRSGVG